MNQVFLLSSSRFPHLRLLFLALHKLPVQEDKELATSSAPTNDLKLASRTGFLSKTKFSLVDSNKELP